MLETMIKLLVTLESFLLKKSRSKESTSTAAHINAQDLVTLRNYALQQGIYSLFFLFLLILLTISS